MKITIIGPGVVGSATGTYLAKLGHRITYVGVDKKQIAKMKKDGLDAMTDLRLAVLNTDVAFICVPTPSNKDGSINLGFVKKVTTGIAKALKEKNQYFLIVMKSTVVPGTCEEVVAPIIDKYHTNNYGLAMNPEFLTEIHSTWSKDEKFRRGMDNQERIVIGSKNQFTTDTMKSIYALSGVPVITVSLKEAEMIKYCSNFALAARIAYWNQIFLLCKNLKMDAQRIADIVCMDPRIGEYGMVCGKAYGGKCLPKDTSAFFYWAKKYHSVPFLKAVDEIDKEMVRKYGRRDGKEYTL